MMAAPSRGAGACLGRRLAARRPTICAQCLLPTTLLAPPTLLRWSSSAAATPTTSPPDPSTVPPPLAQPSDPSTANDSSGLATGPARPPRAFPLVPPASHQIRAGIVLMRPPLLTRKLTPFEEAFYFYQKRLDERLTMHFVQKVYFKRNTPRGIDWKLKLNERQGSPARDLGNYQGQGGEAWQDELMIGDPMSKTEHVYEMLAKDAVMRVSEDAEIIPAEERAPPEMPLSRETDADRKRDVTRLDRKLDRTLYLLVKDGSGKWEFPTANLASDEVLHETASRVLRDTAGENMNTWIIGHAPIAHMVVPPVYEADRTTIRTVGSKTFFIKGRIMAGQADLTANTAGYVQFKWLTREEVKKAVHKPYYESIKNMMPER